MTKGKKQKQDSDYIIIDKKELEDLKQKIDNVITLNTISVDAITIVSKSSIEKSIKNIKSLLKNDDVKNYLQISKIKNYPHYID